MKSRRHPVCTFCAEADQYYCADGPGFAIDHASRRSLTGWRRCVFCGDDAIESYTLRVVEPCRHCSQSFPHDHGPL
jgi:hypothetical protein